MPNQPEFSCPAYTIAITGKSGTNFLRICTRCEGAEPSRILVNGPAASSDLTTQAVIWDEGMRRECVKEQARRAKRK